MEREVGCGREPELVVHDDVHGAADVVAGQLREVEGLRDHALAGERGVAVDEHGEHDPAPLVAEPVLLRPRDSLDHGIDGLEVARVGRERHRDRATRAGGVLAGRAEVVLHVAAAAGHVGIELTLELAEDLRVRLADHVGEHVQPAPVGHAEHGFFHVVVDGRVEQEVQHRDQRLGAFEAEALLAEVLRVEEPLEGLGRVERREDRGVLGDGDVVLRALDLLLDPGLLVDFLDVHVLDADGARVRVAQEAEDVAQRHRAPAREPAGRELAVEVPDREAPVHRVELGVRLRFLAAERVEVGDEVTAHPVDVDELLHLQRLLGPTVRLVFG